MVDCDLPLRILQHQRVINDYVNTARKTFTLWQRVAVGGEGQKTESVFHHMMRDMGRALPVLTSTKNDDDKYEGATVISPTAGFYTCGVQALDFASLYPSIMRRHNLCISTLVSNQGIVEPVLRAVQASGLGGRIALVRVRGSECVVTCDEACATVDEPALAWLDGVEFAVFCVEPRPTIWVQSEPGVTPTVLELLGKERKRIRLVLEEESDKALKDVLDCQQKAVKVIMNSVYGSFEGGVWELAVPRAGGDHDVHWALYDSTDQGDL